MLAEEVLPQFHFALIEAKVTTVAAQQTVATFAPNPVAEIIAQNCTTGSRHDHQRRREAVGYPGIGGCDEQYGLASKGNAHTFDGHKEQHHPVTVGCQTMRQLGCGKMKHVNAAPSISPPVLPWFITFVVVLPRRVPAAVDSGCLRC